MTKRILILSTIIALLAITYIKRSEIKQFLFGTQRTINLSEKTLLIKEDLTADSLAGLLFSVEVIDSKKTFLDEVKKQNLLPNDFEGGKYTVLSGTKISSLVHGFARNSDGQGNNELKVKVIFNRCKTIEDIGQNISKCIVADSASIVDFIYSPKTLSNYNFTLQQIPALFIPDDYEMYYDTDAETFVSFMAKQFKTYWTDARKNKLKTIGFSSPSQAVTLASIVYSEQGKIANEWPIIAKLYLNRLSKGMKLQSDPTFKFCWGNQLANTQRLKANHRNIDCEYNTYKINGLPPGPICIVPTKVIDAVLNPDNNNYLFMCAKPNYSGEHDFTHSDIIHVKNAAIYSRWLTKEGIN